MSEANDPITAVRTMFAAFNARDFDALIETVHPESRWTYYGANPRLAAAEFSGRDAVRRFFERIVSRIDVTSFDDDEYIVQGDTVVVFGGEAGTLRSTRAVPERLDPEVRGAGWPHRRNGGVQHPGGTENEVAVPRVPADDGEGVDDATSSALINRSGADERAIAREIVRRWGWNVTSYQILNPGFTYWIGDERAAVAGYIQYRGTRVVAGAPVARDADFETTVRAFEADAARNDCGVVYFAAEDRIADLAHRSGRPIFPIGAQPFWHPSGFVREFARHASLRSQLSRAHNKGISVRTVTALDAVTSAALERCLREWKDSRGLPPLHFLVETSTLTMRQDRRLLVAERAGVPVAFLVATPIPARNGWLIEQIVRGRDAPNGVSELLLCRAAELLEAEGAALITLGLAPLAHRAQPMVDTSPAWLRVLLTTLHTHGNHYYNFAGLENFKAKFGGAHWAPVYASLSPGTKLTRALMAITAAFSGEPVHRFVPRALLRSLMREARRSVTRH